MSEGGGGDGQHDYRRSSRVSNAAVPPQTGNANGDSSLGTDKKTEEMLPFVQKADLLAKGRGFDRVWLSVHGLVWDVTSVLAWHPGGSKIILDEAGKLDASAAFDRHHSMVILESALGRKYLVGRLADAPISTTTTNTRTDDAINDHVQSTHEVLVTREQRIPWVSLKDAEDEARKRAPEVSFAYWATGADDEMTTTANEIVFRKHCWFKPRVLRNVSSVDMSTTVFGKRVPSPLFISPMAIHGLAHPELAELCAFRAAKRANVIHIAAHLSSRPWEDFLLPDSIVETCPRFLQLYIPKDRSEYLEVLRRAEACKFEALFVTVDSASVGKRERDIRTRQRVAGIKSTVAGTAPRLTQTSQWNDAYSFDDVIELVSLTSLPIILKGIQRGDDAVRAVKAGVAGIMVSNHGGRNLDTARPSLVCLEEIVSALTAAGLKNKVPIFFDGGVRRGTDVIKALCLGADFVGVGRPILYGVAARGEEGALEVLEILHTEMTMTMKLVGSCTVKEIDSTLVEFGKSYL